MSKELKNLQIKIKELKKIAGEIPAVIIIHSLPDRKVAYMSDLGFKLLNQNPSDVIGLSIEEYENRYFNKNDAEYYNNKIINMLIQNTEDSVSFFQQVRTSHTTSNPWEWYMTTSRIFFRDSEGNPIALISTSQKVDSDHFFTKKANRLLAENEFFKKNHKHFSTLTKREKEVLKFLALGKNLSEIADQLFISEMTVQTHKRNLRKKLQATSHKDLTNYANAFNLI